MTQNRFTLALLISIAFFATASAICALDDDNYADMQQFDVKNAPIDAGPDQGHTMDDSLFFSGIDKRVAHLINVCNADKLRQDCAALKAAMVAFIDCAHNAPAIPMNVTIQMSHEAQTILSNHWHTGDPKAHQAPFIDPTYPFQDIRYCDAELSEFLSILKKTIETDDFVGSIEAVANLVFSVKLHSVIPTLSRAIKTFHCMTRWRNIDEFRTCVYEITTAGADAWRILLHELFGELSQETRDLAQDVLKTVVDFQLCLVAADRAADTLTEKQYHRVQHILSYLLRECCAVLPMKLHSYMPRLPDIRECRDHFGQVLSAIGNFASSEAALFDMTKLAARFTLSSLKSVLSAQTLGLAESAQSSHLFMRHVASLTAAFKDIEDTAAKGFQCLLEWVWM